MQGTLGDFLCETCITISKNHTVLLSHIHKVYTNSLFTWNMHYCKCTCCGAVLSYLHEVQ